MPRYDKHWPAQYYRAGPVSDYRAGPNFTGSITDNMNSNMANAKRWNQGGDGVIIYPSFTVPRAVCQ